MLTGVFDPQPRFATVLRSAGSAIPRSRIVERAQRIELRFKKANAKIFCGLAHPCGDGSPSFHRRQAYRRRGKGAPNGPFHRRSDGPAVRSPLAGCARRWEPIPVERLLTGFVVLISRGSFYFRTNHEQTGHEKQRTACSSRLKKRCDGSPPSRARRPPTALASASTSRNRLTSSLVPQGTWHSL